MDAGALFDNAYRAFQANRLTEAQNALHQLRRITTSNPAILHLSALTEKVLGNLENAAGYFDLARKIAPNDAELAANAANLYNQLKDEKRALTTYDDAISLAPLRHDFRLNRAIALLEYGHIGAALDDLEYLQPHCLRDARYWGILAQAFEVKGDRDQAINAYRQALAIEPDRPVAIVGLAKLLMEEGNPDALPLWQSALALMPDSQDILLSTAETYEMLGDYVQATTLLDRGSEAAPDWLAGHQSLARIRGEGAVQDAELFAGYERAVAARPADPMLWASYAAFVRNLDRPEPALVLVERGIQKCGNGNPTLQLLEAAIATDLGDTDRAESCLNALPNDFPGVASVKIRHAIRSGRTDEASEMAQAALQLVPQDISLWALQSLCWRMTGDHRESWLNPKERLWRSIDLALPFDIADLAGDLRTLHVARQHPAGQSMRNGTQTRGSLFLRRERRIQQLKAAISDAVKCYVGSWPDFDAGHPLLRHKEQTLDFAGSWSVRLNAQGFHVSHIHPAGLISSACYIALPPMMGGAEKAGWLNIGDAPPELATGLQPYDIIEPRVGRLVLFPSYLFHGTRPFEEGERLSVAFDMKVA